MGLWKGIWIPIWQGLPLLQVRIHDTLYYKHQKLLDTDWKRGVNISLDTNLPQSVANTAITLVHRRAIAPLSRGNKKLLTFAISQSAPRIQNTNLFSFLLFNFFKMGEFEIFTQLPYRYDKYDIYLSCPNFAHDKCEIYLSAPEMRTIMFKLLTNENRRIFYRTLLKSAQVLAKRLKIYSDIQALGYLYTSGLTSYFLASQILLQRVVLNVCKYGSRHFKVSL